MSVRQGAATYTRMQSIDARAWIAPSAQIFGLVSIGAGSSLWHNAVARAECQEIRIGRFSNLQDFAILHVGYDHPTRVGDFCTVAHHATVSVAGTLLGLRFARCLARVYARFYQLPDARFVPDPAILAAGIAVGAAAAAKPG